MKIQLIFHSPLIYPSILEPPPFSQIKKSFIFFPHGFRFQLYLPIKKAFFSPLAHHPKPPKESSRVFFIQFTKGKSRKKWGRSGNLFFFFFFECEKNARLQREREGEGWLFANEGKKIRVRCYVLGYKVSILDENSDQTS